VHLVSVRIIIIVIIILIIIITDDDVGGGSVGDYDNGVRVLGKVTGQ